MKIVLRARSLGLGLAMAALIPLSASASARADAVTDWNVNAVNALVTTAGQSPTVSTVHLAMVQGAVYDAVNSIDERYEPLVVAVRARRSEEHTSELQSRQYLVCRLLLEKKKTRTTVN